MAKIKIPKLKCLRCGHEWVPRVADTRTCPKCKSAYWDQERDEHTSQEEKEEENY